MSTTDIQAVMKELGSRGGKARAANLTPERRGEISERAAKAARAKQLACVHTNQEQRQIGSETRTYCVSCRRRIVL